MSRFRIVAATSCVVLAGLALAGCSSASTPSWLTPAPPPPQTLQFESEPPGASVQTTQGQICRTPCSLAVPVSGQAVVFSMNGYTPQTIQVSVNQPERSLFSNPPPVLTPNPVAVTLQAIPVAKPTPKLKKAKVAAKVVRPARSEQPSIAAPEPAEAPDHVFPPPPQMAAPASAFPPPPQTR